MRVSRRILLGAAAGAGLAAASAHAQPSEREFTLEHPDGRKTAYRLLAPARGGACPVVLFSHGANSSNRDYDLLWRPWTERGYLVIGADHIDTGPPETQIKHDHGQLWRTRIADVVLPFRQPAPFDAFAESQGAAIDWRKIAAAGHSLGAVVAQGLAGANILDAGAPAPIEGRRPPVAACLAFSPPGPLPKFIPADAWATVTAPSLLQTGDTDVLPGFVDDWRLRLIGFSGGPDRWIIVAHGVNHYFGGLICRRIPGATANLPALDETARLSGDFLDAYVRGRPDAALRLRTRADLGDDGVLAFAAA